MGDIEAPPVKPETDDEYYTYMNDPNYKLRVETAPTPLRSDSFHSLMTREVAEKVFARYERKVIDPFFDRPMTDLEREILENPTLGTTPQRDLVIAASTQEIIDYRMEEAYKLRKSRLFYFCLFMNFFGAVLLLYSLSATVLFEKYDENQTAFYCSFIFFVPAVVWFIYVYLPCKKERERRRKIMRAFKLRNHLKKVRESHYFGHEDSDEEEFAEFDKQFNEGQEQRKSTRGSGSFATKDGGSRKSAKVSVHATPAGTIKPGAGVGAGTGRTSVELPKAPARSSIKVTPSEKKASVQFKIDGKK